MRCVMNIENRRVTLYCPICGNDQFLSLDCALEDLFDSPDDYRVQCADCKSIITKAELLEGNQDIINANIEEIKQEVLEDVERRLKKIFK